MKKNPQLPSRKHGKAKAIAGALALALVACGVVSHHRARL